MIRKLEYHIVSLIIVAVHVKLFMHNVFFMKWKWDLCHIYFCSFITYNSMIVLCCLNIFMKLKRFDLKNYPADEIDLCRSNTNKKKLHPYVSFERLDLVNMKFLNLLYGAAFFAPWKIVFLLIISGMNIFICVVLSLIMGKNEGDQKDNAIVKVYLKFLKIICRVGLWLFGVNRVESYYLCDDEWPKNIVSNHISAVDPFYFISEHASSFVAKKSLRKDIFVGLSVIALRCVFVYREKFEDRRIALESIKERQLLVQDKKNNYPSFVIFSEGTTSNGIQVIEQKKGAFFSLLPITPVLLIYDYGFLNPSYDILPFSWWLFLICANSIALKTYWLPKVYPPDPKKYPKLSEEERINIFHDEVSKIMFQNMKKYNPKAPQDIDDYNDWPGSLRIKTEFFQKALGKIATEYLSKEKKRSEYK
ncbi:phospholipid or glycerol acyltransferase, putative [Plasmodium malariae]|uniref:Phospholipid or glycerol acyltransferase, putative n=1 Tax=Plasmodium malariae TaxID=5858 RepID=A0A1D3JML2_PLAMA|nr:phospholipid or glycerol acyltransferase, putative [Plasmodium malariae]SBT87796.1 phospholipid or glycerol acyltransferase, putative [Plasmodium malariae]